MSDPSAWQQQAKTALQQLNPPGKPVSNAQRFRDLLPDIEQRIADGVPQTDIVAALASAGLHMNIETFRNYLSAARKRLKATDEKRQTTGRTPLPAPPKTAKRLAATASPAKPASLDPTDHRNSHNNPIKW